MKVILRTLAIFAALLLPAVTTAGLAAPDQAGITGTWAHVLPLPDGSSMTTQMQLADDGRYSGNVQVGGTLVWQFSGSWQSDGKSIEYRYEQSSRPLPRDPYIDTDDILRVTPATLRLRSRLSGKEHEFLRVN